MTKRKVIELEAEIVPCAGPDCKNGVTVQGDEWLYETEFAKEEGIDVRNYYCSTACLRRWQDAE